MIAQLLQSIIPIIQRKPLLQLMIQNDNEQLIVTVNSDPYLHFEDVTDMAYGESLSFRKRQQGDRDSR